MSVEKLCFSSAAPSIASTTRPHDFNGTLLSYRFWTGFFSP
jgi:hypothetical protein